MTRGQASPGGSATPSPRSGSPAGLIVFAGVLWVALGAGVTIGVGKAADVLTDYGVALPVLSRGVIRASRWLSGGEPGQYVPGAVFAAVLIVVATGIGVVLARTHGARPMARACAVAAIVLGVLVLTVAAVAIVIPFFSIAQSAQSTS